MSYEGYEEFLCEDGHYFTMGCFDDSVPSCSHCGKLAMHRHSVDCTNGIEENNPSTMMADKIILGFTESINVDHHGNKYFSKVNTWAPAGTEWKPYKHYEWLD